MSPNFTAYTVNDLKRVITNLGFLPGGITADGEQIEYFHPDKTRGFSRNSSIFLPLDNVINKRYAEKLLDDLLSFGFSNEEIVKACKL